jgi:hypothetical protein
MTTEEMSEKIVDFVAHRSGASFPEIIGALGPEAEGDGQWAIAPNTILWVGLSEKFVRAFELVKAKVRPFPADPIVYLMDGAALQMPIAKSIRKEGYKQERWLPVVFNLKDEEKTRRKAKGRHR